MKPRIIQPGETRYVFDLNERKLLAASRPMEPTKRRKTT